MLNPLAHIPTWVLILLISALAAPAALIRRLSASEAVFGSAAAGAAIAFAMALVTEGFGPLYAIGIGSIFIQYCFIALLIVSALRWRPKNRRGT